MVKILKDIERIPTSLVPAFDDLFVDNKIHRTSRTTHEKRMLIINNGAYIEGTEYSSRYKLDDIRNDLIDIYNHKCAYCEQKVEQYNVEHYRPKSIYYWLAYSWDNLILACPHCNFNKGIKFDLLGEAEVLDNTENNIKNINSISLSYNVKEKPKMVNPELIEPKGLISFDVDGSINSADVNFKYTIDECKISRTYLRDGRRKILDDLRKEITLAFSENEEKDQIPVLKHIIKTFKNKATNKENEFIGFREYTMENNWLNVIIKEVKDEW